VDADLTCRSVGLTPDHVAFIKLLAEVAVEDFLREREAQAPGSPTDESSTQGEAQSSARRGM
jgi:hypothetical protein